MTLKKYCAVVTLHVKNAFNSANWGIIKGQLIKLRISDYLTKLVGQYLSERTVLFESGGFCDAEVYASETISAIKSWLGNAGLELADLKWKQA